MEDAAVYVTVGNDSFVIPRAPRPESGSEEDELPEDVDETIASP